MTVLINGRKVEYSAHRYDGRKPAPPERPDERNTSA
jgi:hypothetical protein